MLLLAVPLLAVRCRAVELQRLLPTDAALPGVRITRVGRADSEPAGVLVVSGHVSWVDIFVIGRAARLVRRQGRTDRLASAGSLADLMKVIPIDRTSLRRLPEVVAPIADRLRDGQTVVAFPEGTTWCGLAYGPFRPAMFQAAVDSGRPVQPLRLTYHHRDGRPSTVPAYIGDDTLMRFASAGSITARRTVVHVQFESLQLPGTDRRDLAARCEAAVRGKSAARGRGTRWWRERAIRVAWPRRLF